MPTSSSLSSQLIGSLFSRFNHPISVEVVQHLPVLCYISSLRFGAHVRLAATMPPYIASYVYYHTAIEFENQKYKQCVAIKKILLYHIHSECLKKW